MDGNGRLSLLEALQGFSHMKERLKNDERALGFLRHLFESHAAEFSGPKNLGLSREQFIFLFSKPKVMERLNSYGIFGTMADFWEFVAPEGGWMTVDTLQQGYLKYRDPKYGGDKAVVFLRHLFEQCDADGSGELSKREFMQLLKMPKNIEKLSALGMAVGGEGCASETDIEDALLLFFYELDVDFSGSISVDEMIQGFIRCRDESRMRQLESTGLGVLDLPAEKGTPAAPYMKALTETPKAKNAFQKEKTTKKLEYQKTQTESMPIRAVSPSPDAGKEKKRQHKTVVIA